MHVWPAEGLQLRYCQIALLTLRAARSECWELRASALPHGYLRTGQNLQAGGSQQCLNTSGAQQVAASSQVATMKAFPANRDSAETRSQAARWKAVQGQQSSSCHNLQQYCCTESCEHHRDPCARLEARQLELNRFQPVCLQAHGTRHGSLPHPC